MLRAQLPAPQAVIFRLADVAVIEYWPHGLKRFGTDIAEMLAWMQADFRYGGIIRGGGQAFDPSTVTRFPDIVPELTRLWDQAAEHDVVDIVLANIEPTERAHRPDARG